MRLPRPATTRSLVPLALAAVVAVTSLSLAGCAALGKPIEKPTAKVRGVSVAGVSLTGVEGEVALDIYNPNAFSVPLRRVDWALAIGGAHAVRGTIELSETIPAKAAAPVRVRVAIDARDAAAVTARLSAGQRGYQIAGTMHFSTPVTAVQVSFEGAGQLGDAGRALPSIGGLL